jgi:hypothetical protein
MAFREYTSVFVLRIKYLDRDLPLSLIASLLGTRTIRSHLHVVVHSMEAYLVTEQII